MRCLFFLDSGGVEQEIEEKDKAEENFLCNKTN
jgi:hypothetical protein